LNTVDSHMHVNFNGFSINEIIEYLDRERIDLCWLLSWEEVSPGLWNYQHLSIEDIFEAYLKCPSRIVPFYAPDPHRNDAAAALESWHLRGVRGCGEFKATLNWGSEKVKPVLNTVKQLAMPLVFHMQESYEGVVSHSSATFDKFLYRCLTTNRKTYQIPRRMLRALVDHYTPLKNKFKCYIFPGYMLDFASLEIVLADFPDVNFIGHGPMFWNHISTDAATRREEFPGGPVSGEGIIWRLLREYPNLHADISGYSALNALTRDSAKAKKFLSLFEDKVLYGTDNVMKGQKEYLDSLRLPKSICNKIYGENALKLINK
jgi:predicted TIM-barrel fold metal-dependent hydrolase